MLGIDLTNVQENTPVPAGTYTVRVTKAEVADTKSGGKMIKIQHKIVDGQPHAGRVIFDQFNLANANPQAVQIGLGQLKTMMKAFGHPNPNKLESTSELEGLTGTVMTKVEDSDFGLQTRVKAYKPRTELAAAATGAVAPAAAQPAAGANPF